MAINDTSKGFVMGLAAALITPVAATALLTVGRPAARAAVKTGLILLERGRETLAEVGEVMEDLVAEAKAEMEQAQEDMAEDVTYPDAAADNDAEKTATAAPQQSSDTSSEQASL